MFSPQGRLAKRFSGTGHGHGHSISERTNVSGALDSKAVTDAEAEADRLIDPLGFQIVGEISSQSLQHDHVPSASQGAANGQKLYQDRMAPLCHSTEAPLLENGYRLCFGQHELAQRQGRR
jgi:hypothetical protein